MPFFVEGKEESCIWGLVHISRAEKIANPPLNPVENHVIDDFIFYVIKNLFLIIIRKRLLSIILTIVPIYCTWYCLRFFLYRLFDLLSFILLWSYKFFMTQVPHCWINFKKLLVYLFINYYYKVLTVDLIQLHCFQK